MRSAGAILLALLCAACHRQPVAKPATKSESAPRAPAPGDPAYIAEDPRLAALVGRPGPAIRLQMVDGTRLDLGTLYGSKPVYLKLWATYCIPCRVQMPGFETIYETYRDRMAVIAVNAGVGDDAGKVRAFAQKAGMRMPLAIDDGALGAWIKLQETPLHIVIGRDGRVAYAGHQDGPRLDAAIRSAIAARGGGPVATTDVASVTALKPGDAVPAMILRDSRDRPVAFRAGTTGRPRAILFSSVWCESYLKDTEPQSVPKCRFAREEVDRLAQSAGVEWLGVMSHLWTDPGALAKYEAVARPRIPLAVDTDGTAFRTLGIRRFPAIALIDGNGRFVRVMGPDETGIAGAVAALSRPR
jgi:thiol-disulfide isomerase/thioredoxin